MSDYQECPGCKKQIKKTTSGKYRKHKPFKGATDDNFDCDFSGTVVQEEEEECSQEENSAASPSASSATPPSDDAPESAPPATPSTESSPSGQAEEVSASTASAPDVLPGVTEYAEALDTAHQETITSSKARVDAALKTQFSQPTPPDWERPTLFSQPEPTASPSSSAPAVSDVPTVAYVNEVHGFSQPAGRRSEQPDVEMSTDAASIAARVKELFYSYDNRRSSDNRSAQATMGPSEMGTPCDRRLALSLMRMPPVNPGGDGWAAFVGTCIHAGLEQMFMWADAGTGRFAVEQRLEFGSVFVPKGTADLIDRVLFMVLDHKCQGRWSRNKLKTQGPSPTYRVQAHVYAHGARLRGEKIEKVAIISWPRDEATLDDLYVHVEDYNPGIVQKAFERVERIGEDVKIRMEAVKDADPEGGELAHRAALSEKYNVADDCRFCPFYLPNARHISKGCNGKR